MKLSEKIIKQLKNTPLSIIGVGSNLRGDDYAGMLCAKEIKSFIKKNKIKNIKVFECGVSPENFLEKIVKSSPETVLIIDALECNKKPGSVIVTDIENISFKNFSTHNISLRLFVKYLKESLKCQIIFIGIQPANLHFGRKISKEVIKAVDEVSDIICRSLKK